MPSLSHFLARAFCCVAAMAGASQAAFSMGWQALGHPVENIWVGPFPIPFPNNPTVLAITVTGETGALYCIMNGADPCKSIYTAATTALANGNPIYPYIKTACAAKPGDPTVWCEISGLHVGK